MKNVGYGGTWYGQIQSRKGNITVIRDEQFPPANKGRMYLYNTERDAIIEYDEAIVSPKLIELSEEEVKQVKAKFDKAWEITRKQCVRSQSKSPSPETDNTIENPEDELSSTDNDNVVDIDDDDA